MKKLIAAIMVKNESSVIADIFNVDVDHFVVLDTGSTDNTIEIIEQTCREKKKTCIIYTKPFVDYSTSRNHLLDLCHGLSDYILLLDANEKVHNLDILKNYIETTESKMIANCYVLDESTTFIKVGCVKNDRSIRYKYPVHEVLYCDEDWDEALLLTEYHFSQKRDEIKQSTFERDLQLLEAYEPKDENVYYYLCQTCSDMDNYEKLWKWANILKQYDTDPMYREYVFWAYVFLGISGFFTGEKWKDYFAHAHQYSKRSHERAEPLYFMALSYLKQNEIEEAKSTIELACAIPKPRIGHILLDYIYDEYRWKLQHHLSQI